MKKVFFSRKLIILLPFLLSFTSFLIQAQENSAPEKPLQNKAAPDQAKAQFDYGMSLREQNREESNTWIKKAAAQGFPEAIFYLGYAGIGDKNSLYYYEKAAHAGHVPAFDYALDGFLFRGGGDLIKAKEIADLARKMNIESELHRDLDVVDICYQAGKPQDSYDNGMYPGVVFEDCEALLDNDSKYKNCLFKRGNDIDIATLYANGDYVKQDFWRAISHVCHGTDVPAELTYMVQTLHKAVQTGKLEKRFDYCDHATSSSSVSVCFSQQQASTFKDIRDKLSSLASTFNSKQQKAFEQLQESAYRFFDARASSEQDLSGSLRGVFITEWQRDQKRWFLEIIQQFEQGKLELPTERFNDIDKALQDLYDKLIALKEEAYQAYISGEASLFIRKEDISLTQSYFPEFRDALAKFGTLRYPNTSADDWKSWLSKIRMQQLEELVEQ